MKTNASAPATILDHIRAYESGNKGLKLYCLDAGISFSQMQYCYYKKYKKGEPIAAPEGFTEVSLPTTTATTCNTINAAVEVRLPNGVQITFMNNISVEQIKALL